MGQLRLRLISQAEGQNVVNYLPASVAVGGDITHGGAFHTVFLL